MNTRQKAILKDIITAIVITAIAVVGMIDFKNWINRSEAMRAMEQLGQVALEYRKEYGSIPPESYVQNVKEKLQGSVRLGNFQYRARWIDYDCTGDEILAYTQKHYRSFFSGHGFIVLKLNGSVQWMPEDDFEKLFAQQQKPLEK